MFNPIGSSSGQTVRAGRDRRFCHPIHGYVEVNLQIPGIKCYNEDVLLMVIPTMTYSEKVPVMVGSKIIDWAMGMMTKGELVRANVTWKQAHFGGVMSESLQFPCTNSKKDTEAGKELTPSPSSNPTASRGSAWKMFGDLSILLKRLPSFHLGPLVYMVTLVFWATACGSTCLLNQHEAPSYLPPGTDCYLWGVTPGVFLSTNLPEKHKCPPHRSLSQGNCWQGCSCQSSTSSGSPSGDLGRVCSWPTEGMDPGGVEPLGL